MLVRTLRRQRAWTQEQLALILDVNVRTVQRLEGGAVPSLETAQALASAFGRDARLFLAQTPAEAARPEPAGPPPRPKALNGGRYAAACLLVGAGLASILILTLLIAGPSSPALLAPLLASAMCLALVLRPAR
jgi:transcriptional regulator with XRE-family HTH domain